MLICCACSRNLSNNVLHMHAVFVLCWNIHPCWSCRGSNETMTEARGHWRWRSQGLGGSWRSSSLHTATRYNNKTQKVVILGQKRVSIKIHWGITLYLQVWDSHGSYHAKHDQKHSTDNRVWNGYKDCAEFSKESQKDHKKSSCLEYQSAANLKHKSSTMSSTIINHTSNHKTSVIWSSALQPVPNKPQHI